VSQIKSYSRLKSVGIDKLIAKTDNCASMRALTDGKRQKIVLLAIVLTCLMDEITAIIVHRWKEQYTEEITKKRPKKRVERYMYVYE